MAIYTYRCPACGKTAEVWQSIKSYCEAPEVPKCFCIMEARNQADAEAGRASFSDYFWTPMERYLTRPMLALDIAPWDSYVSPIDGSVITSRSERNEHMAKHGVVMYDEIAPDIERNRKARLQEATAGLKDDLVTAMHRVEAGYTPRVEPVDAIVPAE